MCRGGKKTCLECHFHCLMLLCVCSTDISVKLFGGFIFRPSPFGLSPSSFFPTRLCSVIWWDIHGLCGAVKLQQLLRNFHIRAQISEMLPSIEKKWEIPDLIGPQTLYVFLPETFEIIKIKLHYGQVFSEWIMLTD